MSIVRARVVGHCTLTNWLLIACLSPPLWANRQQDLQNQNLVGGWDLDRDCLVNHINVKDCGRWDFGLCFTNDRFVKVICRTELIERSTVCENLGWLGGKEATILTLRTRDNWTWQPQWRHCVSSQILLLWKWCENVT